MASTTSTMQETALEEHRQALARLPDLSTRIQEMGMAEDYEQFRRRYMGWRMGKAEGAHGELGERQQTGITDFAYWYPNVQEWRFRRTISFWIGITFFQGSFFFTLSSFLYNYPKILEPYAEAVCFGGYLWGKVNYLICTYLMCISSINLHADCTNSGEENDGRNVEEGNPSKDGCDHCGDGASNTLRMNPFAFRTALDNLNAIGAGPWPYLVSVVYFAGVLTFTVGFVAELTCKNEEIESFLVKWSFALGSLQFVLGGAFECIENEVFTSLDITSGWIGAMLNLIGGIGFLVGALIPFFSSSTYWANMSFGVGSLAFLVGSSVMLVMWKDEQFGLTFLGALNKLGGRNGRPLVSTCEDDPAHEHVGFSRTGIFFIHLYCVACAMSCYNFNIELENFRQESTIRGFQLALNEVIPCFIALFAITVRSAMVKTPKAAPYRQLFKFLQFFACLLVINSVLTFLEMLKIDGAIV